MVNRYFVTDLDRFVTILCHFLTILSHFLKEKRNNIITVITATCGWAMTRAFICLLVRANENWSWQWFWLHLLNTSAACSALFQTAACVHAYVYNIHVHMRENMHSDCMPCMHACTCVIMLHIRCIKRSWLRALRVLNLKHF